MTDLMNRRRALMGLRSETDALLYALPAPVSHASRAIFNTGINLLENDMDWTAAIKLNINDRDCCIISNGVSNNYAGNNSAISGVYTDGGFCVAKGSHGGQYMTYAVSKNKKSSFSSSTYPWNYIGIINCCVVHSKNDKSFTFYLSYGGETYAKTAQTYDVYPFATAFNLTTWFKGVLSDLKVYAKALTETECSEFLIGGGVR